MATISPIQPPDRKENRGKNLFKKFRRQAEKGGEGSAAAVVPILFMPPSGSGGSWTDLCLFRFGKRLVQWDLTLFIRTLRKNRTGTWGTGPTSRGFFVPQGENLS
jgi:hypothetical protein